MSGLRLACTHYVCVCYEDASARMFALVLVSYLNYSKRDRGLSSIGQSIGSRCCSCTTSPCCGVSPAASR